MLLSVLNAILMIISYMFITLLCIPTEYEAGEVDIGKLDMVCGDNVVGAKRVPTSRDYIAGMLDDDVIFISIFFMTLYRIKDLDAD